MHKPILVTFTSPTCSGKSFLLNYIRDEAKLPCLISTTTRPARKGEVHGVDYYFISDEESHAIEEQGGFAELAVFRGYRYGVTKEEFKNKLAIGPAAFLIVEPTGINHYVKPALDLGAEWLKYFVYVNLDTRMKRFKSRFESDLRRAVEIAKLENDGDREGILNIARTYTDRLIFALGPEKSWLDMHSWTRVLKGDDSPAENLRWILRDIEHVQDKP
jgi:guanylate kinase